MPRLELPNLGEFPERYHRIVADTFEQLQAFIPEADAQTVPAYVKATGFTYKWTGSAWEVG